jgi:hypothetical protein
MNNQKNKPQQIETRYFVTLAVKDFLKKKRIDFELYNTDIDDHLVDQIAEESGFNSNHPNYRELIAQIVSTFTLNEISQFIGCLGSLRVLELNIEVAAYHVNDPVIPQKGYVAMKVHPVIETFDFSTLQGYSLPFVVRGIYYPDQTC